MKTTYFLMTGILLVFSIGSPVLAAESSTSTKPAINQEVKQRKIEIAQCRAHALEKYLIADRTALRTFDHTKRTALDAYNSALKKAKETKSKEDKTAARKLFEDTRTDAKQIWHNAHKKALETWKSEREACKTNPVT